MNPLSIGALTFGLTMGGVLVGIWIRTALPEHHVNAESKEAVRIGTGLIATITALILGLVTASAKSSFDEMDAAIKAGAADILTLDRDLARYGPETAEIRAALQDALAAKIDALWPPDSARRAHTDPGALGHEAEAVADRIRGLSPQNESQRWLKTRALEVTEKILATRWQVVNALGTSVPVVFLAVLLFWLTIIFMNFGLFCSLSVASVIFLILEMNQPFQGLITLSPDPMRYAHSRMNQ